MMGGYIGRRGEENGMRDAARVSKLASLKQVIKVLVRSCASSVAQF
jgi:hypothetical protein